MSGPRQRRRMSGGRVIGTHQRCRSSTRGEWGASVHRRRQRWARWLALPHQHVARGCERLGRGLSRALELALKARGHLRVAQHVPDAVAPHQKELVLLRTRVDMNLRLGRDRLLLGRQPGSVHPSAALELKIAERT